MKQIRDIYKYIQATAMLIGQSRFRYLIALKGGAALNAILTENGREDLGRLTSDIDIHCDSKRVWIDFYTNIEQILNQNDLGYVYKITDRRSLRKELTSGDSLKFELLDTKTNETIAFKIDMNIKSNKIVSFAFSTLLNMNVYDKYTMMTDKISAISSRKIFRRIKDLYDICVLASLCEYNYTDLRKHIEVKFGDISELENMLTVNNIDAIKHAYDEYVGIYNRPNIDTLLSIVNTFCEPIYSNWKGKAVWNPVIMKWNIIQ